MTLFVAFALITATATAYTNTLEDFDGQFIELGICDRILELPNNFDGLHDALPHDQLMLWAELRATVLFLCQQSHRPNPRLHPVVHHAAELYIALDQYRHPAKCPDLDELREKIFLFSRWMRTYLFRGDQHNIEQIEWILKTLLYFTKNLPASMEPTLMMAMAVLLNGGHSPDEEQRSFFEKLHDLQQRVENGEADLEEASEFGIVMERIKQAKVGSNAPIPILLRLEQLKFEPFGLKEKLQMEAGDVDLKVSEKERLVLGMLMLPGVSWDSIKDKLIALRRRLEDDWRHTNPQWNAGMALLLHEERKEIHQHFIASLKEALPNDGDADRLIRDPKFGFHEL